MANNGNPKQEKTTGNKKKYVTIEEFETKMNEMNAALNEMNTRYSSKIEMLKEIMDQKDQLVSSLSTKVGKLEVELEHVKKSQNFVTNETSDMKKTMDKSLSENSKKLEELNIKTVDLEDRSRRDNIVVFGIPETPSDSNPENSELLITQLFKKHGLIDKDHDMDHDPVFHRVHRLGMKKEDTAKPRPIICKCVYFKDREMFLHSYGKLKGTTISIAEDFSKPTLAVRRQLVQHAKMAKDKNPSIVSFKLNFKRLTVKYINSTTNQTYFRGFSLDDIGNNTNWHNATVK